MRKVSTGFGGVAALALTLTVMPSSAAAQFITRWVNANGVITFSTSSPPPGVKYEPVAMPDWGGGEPAVPAPAPNTNEAGTSGDAATAATESKPAAEPKASGPARLSVQDQTTTSVGEAQWVLAGKVKNEGGEPAAGVGIHISVLEDGQGNPCLDDQGAVSPSTLQPGETGTFELTFNSPCFFGNPRIDIVAEWQEK